jgi:hypothetical protein
MKKKFIFFYTLCVIGLYTSSLFGIRHNLEQFLKITDDDNTTLKQSKLLIASVANNEQKLVQNILDYNPNIKTAVAIPIPKKIQEFITHVSFKPEYPISINDLSYLIIVHWGFDDSFHLGEMIVHNKVAQKVIEIFTELCQAKFPIEKIRLISEYKADDNKSMNDNNSSALCQRSITGKPGIYSKHSFGTAIDINPIQNPYIKGTLILPEIGEKYLDRTKQEKGMITLDSVCYQAFAKRGWTWGGNWKKKFYFDKQSQTYKKYYDLQHFEKVIKEIEKWV